RAALEWCSESGEVELELRIASAVTRTWAVRGHIRETRTWLDHALSLDPAGQPKELRARALGSSAMLGLREGDYTRLVPHAEEALALFEQLGDQRGVADSLDRLATAAANLGDHARSAELYERSIAICREEG